MRVCSFDRVVIFCSLSVEMRSNSLTAGMVRENVLFSERFGGSAAVARAKLEELRGVLAERCPETRRIEGEGLASGIGGREGVVGGRAPGRACSGGVRSVGRV